MIITERCDDPKVCSLAVSVPRTLLRVLGVVFFPPCLSLSPSRICVSLSIRPALRRALAAIDLDPDAGVGLENMAGGWSREIEGEV